ncbi:MAG: hypothetical protein KDD39_14225 [Bdellovibrionales bacterium]|nr:hypothetical protein [Bdellovibrionales bacterium]
MRYPKLLVYLPAAAALGLLLSAMQPIRGLIGHDYYLAFTEYLIGKNHLLVNGFSLPHYTASLCGGLPFFSDPQSTFISLPQVLLSFLPPFPSVLLTYALFYGLGYLGVVLLCEGHYKQPRLSSHLAALFFILNGFCFAHFFVGHVTHHVFLLSPWFLLFPLDSNFESPPRRAALWSLLIAYAVYSGGMHILVLWFLLAVLFLPSWLPNRDWKFLGCAFTFLMLLLPGKLIAGFFFLKNAYPMALNVSTENPFWILYRYFFFMPSETPTHVSFGNLAFGPWEYVGYVSKLALPASLFFFYSRIRQKTHLPRLLAQVVFSASLITIAVGAWQPGFLSAYHNPIKWLGLFTLPFTLAFAHAAGAVEIQLRRGFPLKTLWIAFAFVSAFLLWENTYYTGFFAAKETGISFNPTSANKVWDHLEKGQALPPVHSLNDQRGADIVGLLAGESSLRCAEPTYGYFQEGLHTKLQVGPSAHVRDSSYNLSHPGCLLYPEFYGCKAWDRIPVKEAEAFHAFSQAQADAWELPIWQSVLFLLHAATALLLVLFSLSPVASRVGRMRRKP